MPAFHVACPYTSKPVCFCAHGPGGCAGPGGVQGGEALSRSAGQLWSIWQRPELLFDDAGGASVSIPAPPLHQPSACVSEAAQAATQGVQEARAQLQGSCRAHSEARHAAQRQAATMARREQEHGLPPGPPLSRAAPPGVAGEPLAEVPRPSPPSLHWLPLPPADVLQGVLDEFDPLFGLGDFHPPQQLVRLAQQTLPGPCNVNGHPLLRAKEAVPSLVGAMLEVFWDAPPGAVPPTGWYSAQVEEMSDVPKKKGTTRLFYQLSQSVETLSAKQIADMIKMGYVSILRPPPTA